MLLFAAAVAVVALVATACGGVEGSADARPPGDRPDDGLPSALDDPRDPAFPPPLVDPDEIRSGGPPPDGIPAIDEPRFEPVAEVDWLADVEPVLALEVGGEARAYPIQVMTWHELVNDTIGGVPVTVSFCPLCNSALAYDRRLGDRLLDFGTSGLLYNSSLVMYDRQTETLWTHFDGRAVIGALAGERLATLPVATVSWDDFRTAHPDGSVLSRDTGFSRSYGRNPYVGYDDVTTNPFLFSGELDGRLPAKTRVVVVRDLDGDHPAFALPTETLAADGVVAFRAHGRDLVAVHTTGTASALDTGAIADGVDVGATAVFEAQLDGAPLVLRPDGDTFVDERTGVAYDVLGRPIDGDGPGLVPVEHLDTFWFAIAAFEPDTVIHPG